MKFLQLWKRLVQERGKLSFGRRQEERYPEGKAPPMKTSNCQNANSLERRKAEQTMLWEGFPVQKQLPRYVFPQVWPLIHIEAARTVEEWGQTTSQTGNRVWQLHLHCASFAGRQWSRYRVTLTEAWSGVPEGYWSQLWVAGQILHNAGLKAHCMWSHASHSHRVDGKASVEISGCWRFQDSWRFTEESCRLG